MTVRDFKTRLVRRGARAGVRVHEDLSDRLWAYFELLRRWNRKINLTGFQDSESDAAIDRLMLEPLIAAGHLPAKASSLIDIGSGNGSPAIPVKLAVPSLSLVMVEAKARKCAFLREAVRALTLSDTSVENARFEELLTRPDLHEALDVVTIRAVRVDPRILIGLQAFLRPGGQILLFGTGSEAERVQAVAPPPLTAKATHSLNPDNPSNRLVILAKRPIRPR